MGVLALLPISAACSLFLLDEDFDADPRGAEPADAAVGDRADLDGGHDVQRDDDAGLSGLPPDLFAHWRFDGDTTDSTGNAAHTGALAGAASLSEGGLHGMALLCPATYGAFELTDFLDPGSGSITVIAWVRIDALDDGPANHTLFDKGGSWQNSADRSSGFGMGYRHDSRNVAAFVSDGPDAGGFRGTALAPPLDGFFEDGRFHMVGFVLSRTLAQAQLYFDGTLRGAIAIDGLGVVDNAKSFKLCGTDPAFPLRGLIDEAMVWQRALSAQEVADVVRLVAP
jgi:hypothetical protein